MMAILMNSEKRRTSSPVNLVLNLTDTVDLKNLNYMIDLILYQMSEIILNISSISIKH